MNFKNLLNKAKKAAKNSYSPYSKFKVGAAVLTTNGKIFTGTNIENRSFGATICAERTALTKAVSEGYKNFKAICIVGLNTNDILPPCGICRQFITEFSNNIDVIMANNKLEYKIVKIKDLLPYDSLFELKNK
jgi:cytidine deaminase